MKIKVCGMREASNIEEIAKLKIDFLGFIFYEKSARFVEKQGDPNLDLEQLGQKRVGVFVNSEIPYVLDKVGSYHLDYVQLHGNESPDYCRDLKSVWPDIKIIKVFSVDDEFDFDVTKEYEAYSDFFLFDTKGKDYGGNGVKFNWGILKNYEGMRPFFLSGGIDERSAEKIKALDLRMLIGVDINSKFEIEPGLKSVGKVKAFVSDMNRL